MSKIKEIVTHPVTKYVASAMVFLTGLKYLLDSAVEAGAWVERNK